MKIYSISSIDQTKTYKKQEKKILQQQQEFINPASFSINFYGANPDILTRSKALKLLEPMIKASEEKNFNMSQVLKCFRKENGYSQKLIERLSIFDTLREESKSLANMLFCWALEDETQYEQVMNDIDSFRQRGLNIWDTLANIEAAFLPHDNSKLKYSYNPIYSEKIIEAIDEKRDFRNITSILKSHLDIQNHKSLIVPYYEMISTMLENDYTPVETSSIMDFVSKQKNLTPLYQNTLNDLIPLKLEISDMYSLFSSVGMYHYGKDISNTDLMLGKNIPQNIKSNELKYKYIKSRIEASEYHGKFSQERYDTFNKLGKYVYNEDDAKICEKFVKHLFADKKWDTDKGLELINKTGLQNTFDYYFSPIVSHYKKPFEQLIENGFKAPSEIIIELQDLLHKKETMQALKELQPLTNEHYEFVLAEHLKACYVNKAEVFNKKAFEYLKENINEPNTYTIITHCQTDNGKDLDSKKIDIFSKLEDLWYNEEEIKTFLARKSTFEPDFFKNLEELRDFTTPTEICNVIETSKKTGLSFSYFKELRQKAINALKEGGYEEDEESDTLSEFIDYHLFASLDDTMFIIDTFGEDILFYLLKTKTEDLDDYLWGLNENGEKIDWEPVKKIIYPEKTSKFQKLEQEIKSLKAQLGNCSETKKAQLIHKINEASKERNAMLKRKITDPQEIINTIFVYKKIYETKPKNAKQLVPYLNPQTDEEKQKYTELLNSFVFDTLGIKFKKEETKKYFDFSKSKYLSQLFRANQDFINGMKDLIKCIERIDDASPNGNLNFLVQNTDTRTLFEKHNLDYKKWKDELPYLTSKCVITPNINKITHNTINNLLEDINSESFENLPEKEKTNLIEFFASKGFDLVEKKQIVYDEDGFMEEVENQIVIEKKGKLIDINQLKEFIDLFEEYTNKSNFWKNKNSDELLNNSKEELLDHILKRRKPEVEKALKKRTDKPMEVTIKKVNMLDIPHALTLGNDGGCCTATDGCNSWTAGRYIKNQFIQAIEVIANGRSYGNTMCYMALVDGKVSLILDNIELRSECQFSNELRDEIINFAKKLCTEIGAPNADIYAGINIHKVDFSDFEVKDCEFSILGNSGGEDVYIDYLWNTQIDPNNTYKQDLIKLT